MKRLLLTMAIAVLPFTGAEARWYIAHLGPEPCVPVDDINDNFERVYYGAGTMRVPEDVVALFHRRGIGMTRFNSAPGVAVYQADFVGRPPLTYVFFNNQVACQRFAAAVEHLR
jgi:hypothetical protein